MAGEHYVYNPNHPDYVKSFLPADAHEVIDMGKGWCQFKLTFVDGEHMFLYQQRPGAYGYIAVAITEVQTRTRR